MILGILQFDLHIHDAQSLKDKRKVVLSVKDRLHREHMVTVAEVAHQDTLNLARLGLAMVGSDGKYIGQTLDRIVAKLRQLTDAELGDVSRQVIESSQVEGTESSEEGDDNQDIESLAAELVARAESMIAEHKSIIDDAKNKTPSLNQPPQTSPQIDGTAASPEESNSTQPPRRHSPHNR